MAELFHHTDEDGDRLLVVGVEDLLDRPVVFAINGQDECVFVDRDAALRLAAALLEHYNPKES